jgi:hypothetical protein
MVVAPGRMIDSFLSIHDAESLPLYRMVLKLACVCGGHAALPAMQLCIDSPLSPQLVQPKAQWPTQ